MKNLLLYLLLMMAGISSCHDKVTPQGEYTTNVSEAKKWINGTWKLTAAMYQVPNKTIPNVQMVISGNQITLLQDGKQIDNVDFEIVKTDNTLQLKTNAQPGPDNWYLRNLDLQISTSSMFLYIYNLADGPGYTFKKIK
ncbi:hypothetical protein [Dyadobacter frigoris]|uniref:Lipocalin-like domain-containing protein n=1 Tax=Dyadobacter frigoris TaxID=2576211 RepID=A0A4V6BKD6_9BACT|nr:hypothetical protein [Dyadobacter frigoris]TKT90423.1 hypothetical protein FDK13_18955 [Dyadobacter frigoris]GLU51455.1 hypothetical protein Dfri01_09160 [Dyadobacter frigoris]